MAQKNHFIINDLEQLYLQNHYKGTGYHYAFRMFMIKENKL